MPFILHKSPLFALLSVYMKRLAAFAFSLLLFARVPILFAQNAITTADAFFSSVSEVYAGLSDYSADITISYTGQTSADSETMRGRVVYKAPSRLRIDFSSPATQTILFDGRTLTVYLPAPYNAVLTQSVSPTGSGNVGAGGASLATPEGLSLMRRYYSIAYETGPDPIRLSEGSSIRVIALSLARRSTTEMFRTMRLLVDYNSKLIRRIEADTITGTRIVFSFSNYSLNQGIPNSRFEYDSPSTANVYDNFLFEE